MRKPRYGIVAALGVVAAAVGLTVGGGDRFRAGLGGAGADHHRRCGRPDEQHEAVRLARARRRADRGEEARREGRAELPDQGLQPPAEEAEVLRGAADPGQGAKIALDTCDVEYGAAATQEFLNNGILTMSPCTTTDQMGPQRFGAKGKLAFTIGSTAQDEGSAEAEYAYSRGWRTAIVVKDNPLVYFRNVSDAFAKRFQELGGKIVDRESFTSVRQDDRQRDQQGRAEKADVISFVTAFGELPQFVGGIRSAGNKTPIINSWGGDGTYWNPKNPKVTDYYVDNYASSFGDDPNPAVNKLLQSLLAAKQVPYTASFALGAATIDVLADGAEADRRLDERDEARRGVREASATCATISGPVTYSSTLHSVKGRPWRIMKVQNNKETFLRMWKTQEGGQPQVGRDLPKHDSSTTNGWPGDALRATAVSRAFEGVHALRDVTLELHRHEVVGLIGPNGAGKTTLVNVLTGLRLPLRRHGRARGTATSPRGARTGAAAPGSRARFSTAARSRRSPSARTSRSRRSARARGRARRGGARRGCSSCSGSSAAATSPRAASPHGDERKLGVARALATEPRFLLLDEPAAGLPEAEVPEFAAVVRSVRDEHEAGVLLIDHNMALVMDVCDRIQVLDQGTTLAEGRPPRSAPTSTSTAAYLGEAPVVEE